MIAGKSIWKNGIFIPWESAQTHVLTHALHYGGSAFEGIRFYKTVRGSAIFRLKDHVDRFLFSAGVLKLNLPYSRDDIILAICEVVRNSALEAGYIRPIAFYGYGRLGVNPRDNPVEFIIACWKWGAYLPEGGANVKISRYTRIQPSATDISAKLSGNYVNGVLASLELQGTHYDEALLLDHRGNISEGVGENFFMVKDNIILTPKTGTILPGITRDTVIRLAGKLGFEVVETDISPRQVFQSDEAFFTGTAAEVTPIKSLDDVLLHKGGIGPVTVALKSAYLDVVEGRNPDFIEYLTYI